MIGNLRAVGAIVLAIQLSSCPDAPRMAWKFDYPGYQAAALTTTKQVLEDLGYQIDVYAPESNLIATGLQSAKYSLRRYDYVLIVRVADRIEVFISAQQFIYKRGSELSLFGKSMVDTDVQDRLPLALQGRIMEPVEREFRRLGYSEYTGSD
ncbi:MAG: hypothetical protein ABIA75_04025 [Candidatus Neomarinimicrobiota bacterium]